MFPILRVAFAQHILFEATRKYKRLHFLVAMDCILVFVQAAEVDEPIDNVYQEEPRNVHDQKISTHQLGRPCAL